MELDGPLSPRDFKTELADEHVGEQEDPHEPLRLNTSGPNGSLELTQNWLVKVPADLLEEWSQVKQPNVKLGTIRVYQPSGEIRLVLPGIPSADPNDPPPRPREFLIATHTRNMSNQIVVSDKPKFNDIHNRTRVTQLRGALENEVEVVPNLTESYRTNVKNRHQAAQRKKTAKMLDDTMSQQQIKRTQAGRFNKPAPGTGFGKPTKTTKQPFERAARIARSDLLDMLFGYFKEQNHWSIKDLRAKSQQPESYLRETLQQIAMPERGGPNNGLWRLQDAYANGERPEEEPMMEEMKAEGMDPGAIGFFPPPPQPPLMQPGPSYTEDDDESDEDDDDDDMIMVE